MKRVDGCEEECWWETLVVAAQARFDGVSFSLKEYHAFFCDALVPVHGGWNCPHLQRLSHWRQSGRWERRRERATKKG